MRKPLSVFTIFCISLSSLVLNILDVSAVTYPVGVPSGEVVGGTFNTYFSNMFGSGITDSVLDYTKGCPSGQVMRGLSNTGVLLCVSPGLNVTSSATLSLSGLLIGTLNYVAKYNNLAGTGINISQIYDNGTNVAIGSGFTTPAYKLDVAGTGSFYGLRVSSGAMNGYVLTSNATGMATWAIAPSPCIVGGTGLDNTCYGVNSLTSNTTGYFNTANGKNSLTSNTTGYYNTANGKNSLYSNIAGYNNTVNGVSALYSNITGYNNTTNGLQSLYDNTTGSNNTTIGYNTARGITTGSNNTILGANITGLAAGLSNNIIIADGAGNQRIKVDATGNMGIGTASPTAKLEVAGQIKLTGGNPGIGKTLTSDAAGLATWTDTVSGSTATGIVSGAGNQNYLSKFGPGGIGIYSSQLYDDNTNVGIGTITPGAKLEVVGQIKITGGAPGINKVLSSDAAGLATWVSLSSVSGVWSILGNSGTVAGTNFIGTTDAQDLVFKTNNTEKLRLTSAGNLGVGTATPGTKLEVAGQVKITGGSPSAGKVLTSDASGLATWTTAPSPCIPTGTGTGNTCYGSGALQVNTSGWNNVANGVYSLFSNTTGYHNTANGAQSLFSNTTGNYNVANGAQSLLYNSTGSFNTANGFDSLFSNTTGNYNTTNGAYSLFSNTIGWGNTANGTNSLKSNITGFSNTANGMNSLFSNTTGNYNTANGLNSLYSNATGSDNTANGFQSLFSNTIGNHNTANGLNSLFENTTGSDNTALGYNTARGITTGSNNTILGANITGLAAGLSNNIIIADGAGNQRINVDATGNVGIGTNAPRSKLDVYTAAGTWGGPVNTGIVQTSGLFRMGGGDVTFDYGVFASGIGWLQTGRRSDLSNTFALSINPNGGNVGIGTANPGAKLEVAGQVKIATAGAYLDYRPNAVSCTNGQILSWNNVSTRWECSSNAPGISGSGLTTNYVTKWNGTSIANSQLFDNGTNVGIGTATPGSKLEVVGNSYFNGNVTVSGSLIVDKIVNRTVNNISISGSLLPDSGAPLIYRDIGSAAQKWNNLYLAGQIAIAGGTPGLGKVLTSDATGLATWSSTVSGSTATGIIGGTQNYVPKFGTGGTGLYLSQFFDNGTNVGIGTVAPTSKLHVVGNIKATSTIDTDTQFWGQASDTVSAPSYSWTTDTNMGMFRPAADTIGFTTNGAERARISSTGNMGIGTTNPGAKLEINAGVANTSGLKFTTLLSTSTPYAGTSVGLGVDAAGNVVPVSNGDVVVYDALGRSGPAPVPDPDLPNREISYNFNKYFAIPTKQSFVVSDGNGAGYNAPYFKENGTSGICSGGGSPYDCAVADPFTGLSASPNNSFTMTAKGSTYGYQMALGARGDAPLFARSGRFTGAQTNGLFLADGVTPTPWQKVLTVPANHVEYFYVNIGYNSQLTAIPGGGNVGIGTSIPDRRLVISGSGTTNSATQQVQIRRGVQGADASLSTTYGTPYMNIGGQENRVNSLQTIGFGKSLLGSAGYAPAEIGFLTTSVAGSTKGDIVFASRNGTTNVVPTEVMRIESTGDVGIGVSNPTQQLQISRSMSIPATTSASTGVLYKGATRFLHDYTSSAFAPNIFMGLNAGNFTMTQGYNIGIGDSALNLNTTGFSNIAIGYLALSNNTTGGNNAAIGSESLELNQTGNNNVANGFKSLYANLTGGNNTSIGTESLTANNIGSNNTANGYQAMNKNTSGNSNTAIGSQSLFTNVSGQFNTAVGYQALRIANSPSNNTAIGYLAGNTITTGASNIVIGANAQVASPTGSNQLSIGNWLYGSGGNIGIGIASPLTKFDVAGQGRFNELMIVNGSIEGGQITLGYKGTTITGEGASTWNIDVDTFNSFRIFRRNSTNVLDQSFSILENGNIGIGTIAPTAKLEVAGNFKLGTNGTTTNAMGVCTIAAKVITTTAATSTCTGIPASTAVAVNCTAAAAFTTVNTTSLYCRANGTLNTVVCNTTVANSVSTSYTCMWMY